MNIVIVDFDDSFTYNILGELKQLGLSSNVIHWTDLSESSDFDLLILGPGPGHPHDYAAIFPLIKKLMAEDKKILGICLGHQILWNLQDALVTRSKYPVHGEKLELMLDSYWSTFFGLPRLMVQRYNSLAVLEHSIITEAKLLSFDNEVMASVQGHLVGLQFHPESLGTKKRKSIFSALLGHFFAS
ncbi:MAG TPA: aminodeoxychorismate/anthranilate synthase component II [Bacteriovoracaceae bacterium]|nr:aminodeoxychorismate/anthranilate synthase component II [Bacteriovoracaceae bacterium]